MYTFLSKQNRENGENVSNLQLLSKCCNIGNSQDQVYVEPNGLYVARRSNFKNVAVNAFCRDFVNVSDIILRY